MIELREITLDNFETCIQLDLLKDQWQYVASNAYSLAEAYAISKEGKDTPLPYAIYQEGVMVGFVMAVYQPMDHDNPCDDEDVYYLPRLMIDKNHQGKGYGKVAMYKLMEIIKSKIYGKADVIVLSCNKNNAQAYNLYQALGFIDTDEYDDDGDVYMRLEI